MKYFLVIIEYKTDIKNIERLTDLHREYLKNGYDQGMFLISGPKVPRTGGVVIARGISKEDVEQFFAKDPYNLNSYADYKFIEFNPKSSRPEIKDWLNN